MQAVRFLSVGMNREIIQGIRADAGGHPETLRGIGIGRLDASEDDLRRLFLLLFC